MGTTYPRRPWFGPVAAFAGLLLLFPATGAAAHCGDEVKVTIIAVLATDRNSKVDPEVKCIAEEVRKLEPSLTGFRLKTTTCKSLMIGKKDTFPLVEGETATVEVHHGVNKEKRVGLTLKPPLVGEITYVTICGKFFPVVTRYQTKDRERLIIAVMVRPCNGKR